MSYKHAYIAGLFDGEGCISSTMQWIKGKYEKYPRIAIQISITNQDIRCLELVQEEFGGSITLKDKSTSKVYAWRVVGKRPMKDFLISMQPYLIVKKEQTNEALEFIDTLRDKSLGCVPLSDKVHSKRLKIHDSLKKLKVIDIS